MTDNSFYAATTIGPDGVIWTGTFTGYTIFRPRRPKPAPELVDACSLQRCATDSPHLFAGSSRGETLRWTESDDAILARSGADTLVGRPGDDCLYGERGRDTARGKRGSDVLLGGGGRDSLEGNGGNDRAWGGAPRIGCEVAGAATS